VSRGGGLLRRGRVCGRLGRCKKERIIFDWTWEADYRLKKGPAWIRVRRPPEGGAEDEDLRNSSRKESSGSGDGECEGEKRARYIKIIRKKKILVTGHSIMESDLETIS